MSRFSLTMIRSNYATYNVYTVYTVYAVYAICAIYIICQQSDAKPVHRSFSNSICNPITKRSIKISIDKIKFNKSTVVTCLACYNYTFMYLYQFQSLLRIDYTATNQTQNEIQKVKNIYHYRFNYTHVSNINGYVTCYNGFEFSLPNLAETSADNQLIVYAWRKSYPNYSFPDRNERHEFILYVEHIFQYSRYSSLRCELISNDFYSYKYLSNYDNSTFRHVITTSYRYNLDAFYIRIYMFSIHKVYEDSDQGDTFVGFTKVLDYDEDVIKYITREAKHIEL